MVEENRNLNDAEEIGVTIKINFLPLLDKPSVYATNLFVQDTADEVVLLFYEVVHPLVRPEDKKGAVERLKQEGVDAICVSRVVIAKHKFPGFAQAMNITAERIMAQFAELEKGNADNSTDNK